MDLLPFDELRAIGWHKLAVSETLHSMLEEFQTDPEANKLRTPSGKIEIFLERYASFGYHDCAGHPIWMDPVEWLGSAKDSQLDNGRLSQAGRIDGYEPALIHPIDAAARGIRQHDLIKVFNSRGACLCAAILWLRLRCSSF